MTDTQLFEDRGNHCIRKISTDGIVTTISGQPGVRGFKYGRDSLWFQPYGLIVGQDRELFVTDRYNHAVRRISLDDFTVVTIAGGKQQGGHKDGQGGEAEFNYPLGITQLSNKDLIVSDADNHVLRQITLDGLVTTIAGISFFLFFVWICCWGLKRLINFCQKRHSWQERIS